MSSRDLDAHPNQVLIFPATGNNFYICKSAPGKATSSAEWQIALYTDDGAGIYTIKYADGTPAFVKIANNRSTYSY